MIREMPPVHPAAELFPMMDDGELRALAEDIKANGLQQPIVMFGPRILDGRNRWKACELAGVEPKLRDWNGKDAVAYVRSLNLHRRHLTPAQRAALAIKVEPVYAEAAAKEKGKGAGRPPKSKDGNRPKKKQNEKSRALAQAAKETGASLDSAKAMKHVAQRAPEVVELVQRGRVDTVADAKRLADMPADDRAIAISHITKGESVGNAIGNASEEDGAAKEVTSSLEAFDRAARALDRAALRLESVLEKHGASVAGVRVQQIRASVLLAGQRIDDLIKKMDGE